MSGISLDQLKSDFEMFRDQCRLLIRSRNTFDILFIQDDVTTKMLNDTASWFFKDLHRLLNEAYYLQVGRVIDPITSPQNQNLSSGYIVKRLKEHDLLTDEICDLLKKLEEHRKKTNPARNKYIAHLDLNKFRKRIPLGNCTAGKHFKFLENLNDFSDCVALKLGLSREDYFWDNRDGDVNDLIKLLKQANGKKDT